MKPPTRKPPARVLSLHTGNPLGPDVITNADWERAIAAQDNVLFAQGYERQVLGQIRVRIERGARQENAKYYFDAGRGIVRRREPKEDAS